MTSTIGIRVYRIGVNERWNSAPLPLDSRNLTESVPNFISRFIKRHTKVTQNNELERSWYFQIKEDDGPGNSLGYIHYGTFGFESNFVDAKTKQKNYRRKTTDIEEIPLYYEFWCPKNSSFGLAAFQSFQGRSCINLLMSKIREHFEAANPQHVITFKKLQPNDVKGSAYTSAPVRQLRLIKRKASSDIAGQYFNNDSHDPVDLEIIISAQRSRSLGTLGKIFNSVKSGQRSVIIHDGIEFPEAVAEIRIGEKTRKVGVLGLNGDAGVIDLTDAVSRGSDGHPTFSSLKDEVDFIIHDFYETLSGSKL